MADLKDETETYLDFLIRCKDDSRLSGVPSNVIRTARNQDFGSANQKIGHQYYVLSGDTHYFVSRILFLNHVSVYSSFCGHQCIENYLKAYWKYRSPNSRPLEGHNLRKLLDNCLTVLPESDSILRSPRIEVIIDKYEPYYELPRYPVYRRGPSQGGAKHMCLYPDDIYVLDYFVMQMRQLIPYPDKMFDVLKERQLLDLAAFSKPSNLSDLFIYNNINCITEK